MKNHTNIYDINGNLVRKAGDNTKLTAEEAREKNKYYREKLEELKNKENLTEDDKKLITAYETYCRNLSNYEFQKIMAMDKDTMTSYISKNIATNTTKEEVEDALNELKTDLGGESSMDTEVEQSLVEPASISQEDLLVEREDNPTVMEEYVSPIGEASEEYVHFSEMPISNEISNSPIGEASEKIEEP